MCLVLWVNLSEGRMNISRGASTVPWGTEFLMIEVVDFAWSTINWHLRSLHEEQRLGWDFPDFQ